MKVFGWDIVNGEDRGFPVDKGRLFNLPSGFIRGKLQLCADLAGQGVDLADLVQIRAVYMPGASNHFVIDHIRVQPCVLLEHVLIDQGTNAALTADIAVALQDRENIAQLDAADAQLLGKRLLWREAICRFGIFAN